MAAAQPLPVGLRRILLVTVRAGLWSERAALRRRQWTGLPLVVLATGVPLAAVYAMFCSVILSGGLIASVLFGLAVLIAWLIVTLLLKSFFAVAIVMWRWTHPATSFFHAVRTDEGAAVEHAHRSGNQLIGTALVAWPPRLGLGRQCQREVRLLHPGPISGTATNKWLMTNYYRQTSDGKSRKMRWDPTAREDAAASDGDAAADR